MTVQNMNADIQTQLIKILQSLNLSASEQDLKRHAFCLQMTNAFGGISDLPRARQKGGRMARRELERVFHKAIALAKDLGGLHSEALRAFESVRVAREIFIR